MQNDPYSRDTPGVGDPANNLITLLANDDADIPVGVKGLRIYNPETTVQTVHCITVTGDTTSFLVPPSSIWIEALRISRLLTATGATLVVQAYTDVSEINNA